jgi:hypothetical protein
LVAYVTLRGSNQSPLQLWCHLLIQNRTPLSKEEFYNYPDLRDRRFATSYPIRTPLSKEEFYDYPDSRDRRFYATSLSKGGPPNPRRNFTTTPIRGIDAFIGCLLSHGRWGSQMELYLSSKFASALEKLKYQRISLHRICILLIMHV